MRTVFSGPLGSALAVVTLAASGGLLLRAQGVPTLAGLTPQQIPTVTVGPRSTGTSAISGVVTDGTTGRPVPGAVVTLSNLDKNITAGQRMLADSRGRFVFRNLPASESYFLGAERFGYAYTRYGWTAPDQSLTAADILRLTVAEGQWRNDIRIPLWRLPSISGRVVDERGEPLVGVVVRVFTTGRVSGNVYLAAGPVTTTDDRGVYRLSGLPSGRYVVSVLSVQSTVPNTIGDGLQTRPVGALESGSRASTASWVSVDVTDRHRLALTNFATPPPPDGGRARAYRQTFFPGVPESAQAEIIQIGYGDVRTGVDFRVEPVPAVRVSGWMEPENQTGVLPRLLRLVPVGSEQLGFGSEAATTLLEPNGRFTFLNVPAGRYTLLAQSSIIEFRVGSDNIRLPAAAGFPVGGSGSGVVGAGSGLSYTTRRSEPATLWTRSAVVVGDRDIDDLNLTLRRAATLRGRFVFAEGTTPPAVNPQIEFFVEPATGDPSFGELLGKTTRGDTSFAFTLEGLLGTTYIVNWVFPLATGVLTNVVEPYGIVSAMFEGRDLAQVGFDASNGGTLDEIVITLTDKKVEINGRVQGQRGQAAATVIAFPVERARWTNFGLRPSRVQSARSSSAGTYRLQRLAAGEYYVIAVPMTDPAVWMTPEFFAAAAPNATRVSIAWGDTRAVDLQMVEVVRP